MKKFLGMMILVIGLVGCGQNQQGMLEEPKPLDVSVEFQPTELKVGEEFRVVATVTMGEENVKDASEVVFELWKTGQEEHEMLTGENKKDGTYEIKTKVDEEGTYYVIPHVTARNLHTMPKIEFEVKKF